MGKAIILSGISFAGVSIGTIHLAGNVPIQALNISGPVQVIGAADAATFLPTYTPVNTTQRGVTWSIVSGGESASINSASGVLSVLQGATEETVVIRATSVYNPAITADKSIIVSYQSSGTGYITSGLIAHWDGIDKNNGGDSWKWGDLIGNIVGTAHEESIFGHGGDYANFANYNYLSLSSNIPVTATDYTIEICYEKSANPGKEVLLLSGKSLSDAYAVFATWGTSAGDYIITGRNTEEQKCWVNAVTYPQTASVVNQQKCIINGVSAALSESQNYLNGAANLQRIASGSSGNMFTGKIYSIRIYDRALSDAEIANNQAYDIIRFGI